jgi:hypothetical protein
MFHHISLANSPKILWEKKFCKYLCLFVYSKFEYFRSEKKDENDPLGLQGYVWQTSLIIHIYIRHFYPEYIFNHSNIMENNFLRLSIFSIFFYVSSRVKESLSVKLGGVFNTTIEQEKICIEPHKSYIFPKMA